MRFSSVRRSSSAKSSRNQASSGAVSGAPARMGTWRPTLGSGPRGSWPRYAVAVCSTPSTSSSLLVIWSMSTFLSSARPGERRAGAAGQAGGGEEEEGREGGEGIGGPAAGGARVVDAAALVELPERQGGRARDDEVQVVALNEWLARPGGRVQEDGHAPPRGEEGRQDDRHAGDAGAGQGEEEGRGHGREWQEVAAGDRLEGGGLARQGDRDAGGERRRQGRREGKTGRP